MKAALDSCRDFKRDVLKAVTALENDINKIPEDNWFSSWIWVSETQAQKTILLKSLNEIKKHLNEKVTNDIPLLYEAIVNFDAVRTSLSLLDKDRKFKSITQNNTLRAILTRYDDAEKYNFSVDNFFSETQRNLLSDNPKYIKTLFENSAKDEKLIKALRHEIASMKKKLVDMDKLKVELILTKAANALALKQCNDLEISSQMANHRLNNHEQETARYKKHISSLEEELYDLRDENQKLSRQQDSGGRNNYSSGNTNYNDNGLFSKPSKPRTLLSHAPAVGKRSLWDGDNEETPMYVHYSSYLNN